MTRPGTGDELELDPKPAERLGVGERFHVARESTSTPSVLEFWTWAFSDLRDNTNRGVLAEFLVRWALGVRGGVRSSWDDWDLTSPDGVKVEVKASGYLQSWHQKKLSQISFGRLTGRGWDPRTGSLEERRRLRADVFVFAVQTCRVPKDYGPLDLDQWRFYVLGRDAVESTKVRSISLATVQKLDPIECSYSGLRAAVKTVLGRSE